MITNYFFKVLTSYMFFVVLLIQVVPLNAQQIKRTNCFILYLNAPSATGLSPLKSEEYEIGKATWMADFGIEMKFGGIFLVSTGMGIGGIKDNNSFTQTTTLGEMESSFTTISYNFKTGLWIPEFSVLKKRDLHVALGTNIGFEDLSGIRQIDNCVDCNKEKFKFDGGFFIEPEINLFFFQDVFGLGTSYRYYFTNTDLEYKVILLKLMIRANLKN